MFSILAHVWEGLALSRSGRRPLGSHRRSPHALCTPPLLGRRWYSPESTAPHHSRPCRESEPCLSICASASAPLADNPLAATAHHLDLLLHLAHKMRDLDIATSNVGHTTRPLGKRTARELMRSCIKEGCDVDVAELPPWHGPCRAMTAVHHYLISTPSPIGWGGGPRSKRTSVFWEEDLIQHKCDFALVWRRRPCLTWYLSHFFRSCLCLCSLHIIYVFILFSSDNSLTFAYSTLLRQIPYKNIKVMLHEDEVELARSMGSWEATHGTT